MSYDVETVYRLLPEVYRVRDAELGGPLKGLVALLAEQADRMDQEILATYDNWFIETCADWLAPYIGDLLRVRPLHAVSTATASQRAVVANTLGYRRAKGTAAVLERLAYDVSGWRARAVEFFQLLATTQHLNHLGRRVPRTPDIRNSAALELLNSPFDRAGHTAEVRNPGVGGRYNIPNVGLFLHRLEAYPMEKAAPRRTGAPTWQYTFSQIGRDAPLFNQPPAKPPDRLVKERDLPAPLRRRPLYDELTVPGAPALYFADPPVIEVFAQGAAQPVPVANLRVCDLSTWQQPAAPIQASIDPVLGRLAVQGITPRWVSYAYGFSGDLGGGPYDRRAGVNCWYDRRTRPVDWQMGVTQDQAALNDPANANYLVASLKDALQAWRNWLAARNKPAFGIIAILDNGSYTQALTGADAITVPAASRLAIVAAGWPGVPVVGLVQPVNGEIEPMNRRPHLQAPVEIEGTSAAGVPDGGEVTIDGLLIEGTVVVRPGNLRRLLLSHSTVVPDVAATPALDARVSGAIGLRDNANLEVALCRSICGGVRAQAPIPSVRVESSIIDAAGGAALDVPAAALQIDTTTVIGDIAHARTLHAGNSLLLGDVSVDRHQEGCVRFSYVRDSASTPRRFRCQPDMALAGTSLPPDEVRERIRPQLTSLTYGDPGYAQLSVRTADEVRTGAEDGSEMGAFSFLKQPQREQNLRSALDEYLRVGLDAAIFHVT
jgi:hypothetical protein